VKRHYNGARLVLAQDLCPHCETLLDTIYTFAHGVNRVVASRWVREGTATQQATSIEDHCTVCGYTITRK